MAKFIFEIDDPWLAQKIETVIRKHTTEYAIDRALAAELSHLRKAARLTQKSTQYLTGISHVSISRIESALQKPKPETVAILKQTYRDAIERNQKR